MSEKEVPQFDNFDDFFEFYVSQHSKRATRALHLVGTSLGIGIAIPSLAFGPRKAALLGLAVGYGFAWASHFAIEGNRPASFGHPLWSFRGDWKMIYAMVSGHDDELQSTADRVLAEAASANPAER